MTPALPEVVGGRFPFCNGPVAAAILPPATVGMLKGKHGGGLRRKGSNPFKVPPPVAQAGKQVMGHFAGFGKVGRGWLTGSRGGGYKDTASAAASMRKVSSEKMKIDRLPC